MSLVSSLVDLDRTVLLFLFSFSKDCFFSFDVVIMSCSILFRLQLIYVCVLSLRGFFSIRPSRFKLIGWVGDGGVEGFEEEEALSENELAGGEQHD